MQRPNFDVYYGKMAVLAATRATCPRGHVGAVIVVDNRLVTTGYNGSPPGRAHCTDIGCYMIDGHCERTIHGEENAIAQAARQGISIAGGMIYVHLQILTTANYREAEGVACRNCQQMIVASGLAEVICVNSEGIPYWRKLAKDLDWTYQAEVEPLAIKETHV